MANHTLSDIAIPPELNETLEYVYNESCKAAKLANLPPPKKNEVYRLLLNLGAEAWKNLRIQPPSQKK
jgi:hypothetical protein